ncbi:ABC transporter permease [Butyrivibrio sp. INlla16]|uniref:ABC transporter permease n=1 Tax=Butyrivibrio sp. INlla16 TaxID=1520807 RepID=UPI000AAA6E95|nr:ABC transporter permease [Butyrivibrio sp. INlla16]
MKKTQLLDTFRNIKKQLVSWLSIIVISSFALAAYLGLTYSAYGLEKAGQNLYDSTNFRDIQITSNCLISESDLEQIKKVPGITGVEGLLRTSGRISGNNITKPVYITSVPKHIGLPILQEGHLPESDSECIIEQYLADKLGIKIGDSLSIKDAYDEDIPELNLNSFKVTGIFLHAEHASFDLEETYCILVDNSAFDSSKFDNCYCLADVTFDNPEHFRTFSRDYFNLSDTYIDSLETLGKSLSSERYDKYTKFMDEQLSDSEKDLSDAEAQLSLAAKTVPSLKGKTGEIMADMSNMLSVIISTDPSEYKTADEQITAYEDAKKEYDHAVKRVTDTRNGLNKILGMGKSEWYVFNRNANPCFVFLKNNTENLRALNLSFSLLFVAIAIMVIFASLSRMVYEQRSIIGISKALGLHQFEIFSKYLIFGFSGAVLGIILGIALSLFIIEWIVALGYGDHFIFGPFPFAIDIIPTVVSVLVAVIVAILSINASCSSLLKETAKKLLSPRIPKGHAKALEKSPFLKRLNLYNRMILLNMRSDIVRVIVTIISVAGCCSLVVIGFSLRASIMGAIKYQISDYTHYDAKISYSNEISPSASGDIKDILKGHNISYISFLNKHGSVQVDDTLEYMEFLICDDLKSFSNFRPLTSLGEKEGLIITNRLAEIYDLGEGDSIYVIDDMGYKHSAKVSAVAKNYIGRYVICTKTYYEQIMEDTFENNTFFIKLNSSVDEVSLQDDLLNIQGYEAYTPASEQVEMFNNLLIVLNLVIGLLIILSGVMALFVLLNLADMYLLSKKNELTIMRINGFTVKETVLYAVREVFFTTTTGIILGVIIGCIIVYSIIRTMEQVHLMFVRSPSIPSCILGTLITAGFSIGIYYLSMKKVKDLSLKDI